MSDARFVVALAGTLPDADALGSIVEGALVVAADGAALGLLERGITPDVVIGDLDSIGDARAGLVAVGATIVEVPSQETNDFEKALLWIEARPPAGHPYAVTVIGIDGGMFDHTLNNVSVAARHARSLSITIIAGRMIGRLVTGSHAFECSPGERVSLIPVPAARVTTEGLVWALVDEWLRLGEREGASNRTSAAYVRIDVREGTLLVLRPGESV